MEGIKRTRGWSKLAMITLVVALIALTACSSPTATPAPTATSGPAATTSAVATPTATSPAPAATPTPSGKVYKARYSLWTAQNDIRSVYSDKFADMVREATNGQVDISVFYNGTLFGSGDVIQAVGKNAVESGLLPGGVMPGFIPEYAAEQLWFVLTPETTEKLWKETAAGKAVIEAEQKQLTLKIVGWIPLGPNAVFSRSPITGLDDFKGKKARYLSKPAIPFYSALGMTYVSIGTSEVYNALQNGMVDVLTTSAQPMKNSSWWDYAKYGILPFLGWYTGQVAFNADWWNALPKDLQDKVLSAGQKITAEAFDGVFADAQAFYDEFKQHGGTVTTLTPAQVSEIQAHLSAQGAFDEIKKQIGPDVWEAISQLSGGKV